MTTPDLKECLALSTEAAREAASSVLIHHDQRVLSSEGKDIKISGDKKLNDIIVNFLERNSPYPVLSEEETSADSPSVTTGYHWIVDPLDGSLNFSRGIPIFCISIAFWKEKVPLTGVIYDFQHDEMFTGLVGEAAWLNGESIRVSSVREPKDAVLGTGFPVRTDYSESALLHFVREIQLFKKVRLLGSAAISLAYVAAGRMDMYRENDIALWDVAAGIAMVQAAGGIVSSKPSPVINRVTVEASNPFLYDTYHSKKNEGGE